MRQRIIAVINHIKKNLPRLISIICVLVLAFSLFMIGKKLYGYYRDDARYKKIREQVSSNHSSSKFAEVFAGTAPGETAPAGSETADNADSAGNGTASLPYAVGAGNMAELSGDGILLDYAEVKKQNKDLMGWIRMPGFKKELDYPVMHTVDNEYYLTHDFYGNESQAGSIFMDNRNNPLAVDRHIILYGHAMKDMSMFGNLKDYPGKAEQHANSTKIYLDLLNTRLEYEVFSVYYEDATYNYRQTDFSGEEDYLAFIEKLRSKSLYDYKTALGSRDKILTLSTCNNDMGSNIRSVTHARLVRQILYNGGSSGEEALNTGSTPKEVVSANVYLKQLSLEYGDAKKPEKAELKPAFSSGIKEFDAVVPSQVETARLFLEKADTEAVTEATLNGENADTNALKLVYGENILKLKIISRDKKFSRTLTMKIMRTPLPTPTPTPEPSATSEETAAAVTTAVPAATSAVPAG